MQAQCPPHSPCRSFLSLPEGKRAKPSSLRPPQRTLTGSGLLAGGFPHQMLRLPARSSFNPPVVPGPEHGLGVVGADEGVGAVPSPAPVLKLHEHPLPHVLELVVYLRQTVRGTSLT